MSENLHLIRPVVKKKKRQQLLHLRLEGNDALRRFELADVNCHPWKSRPLPVPHLLASA